MPLPSYLATHLVPGALAELEITTSTQLMGTEHGDVLYTIQQLSSIVSQCVTPPIWPSFGERILESQMAEYKSLPAKVVEHLVHDMFIRDATNLSGRQLSTMIDGLAHALIVFDRFQTQLTRDMLQPLLAGLTKQPVDQQATIFKIMMSAIPLNKVIISFVSVLRS
jgi:hypothetical protein